jgi:TetR/AcrR family fatty acid metabolism transcriptional regulator
MATRLRRLPASERRKQILRSAVRVFARSNYRAAKVAEIAAEAGVSEALLYKLFPSKQAIFLEILQHMSQRIVVAWQEEVDREEDALAALHNMGVTYYRRMKEHPEELRVQFQAISEIAEREIAERLRADHESYVRFISKVIRKGQRQGLVRKDLDVEMLGFLFNGGGILMNMMRLLSLERRFNDALVQRLMDHLVDSIKASACSDARRVSVPGR